MTKDRRKKCPVCHEFPLMTGSDKCYYHSNSAYSFYGYPNLDYRTEVRLFLELDDLHANVPTIAVVEETPFHELDEKRFVNGAASWRRGTMGQQAHVVSHQYGNEAELFKCTPEFHAEHYPRAEPHNCAHAKGKTCTCRCHNSHHGELKEL